MVLGWALVWILNQPMLSVADEDLEDEVWVCSIFLSIAEFLEGS